MFCINFVTWLSSIFLASERCTFFALLQCSGGYPSGPMGSTHSRKTKTFRSSGSFKTAQHKPHSAIPEVRCLLVHKAKPRVKCFYQYLKLMENQTRFTHKKWNYISYSYTPWEHLAEICLISSSNNMEVPVDSVMEHQEQVSGYVCILE